MGLNPREVKRLLRRLGIPDLNLEEVSGVTKVVIYLGDGSTIEVNRPVVARMRIQGMSIFQVQASDSDVKVNKPQPIVAQPRPSIIIQQPQTQPQSQPATQQVPAQYEPSEEDVRLVMEQTGCSREEAVRALRETNGDIAEAILRIQSTRK